MCYTLEKEKRMTKKKEEICEPNVVFYEDTIEIWDREGNSVLWRKDEWKENDEVPFYIATAIKTAFEGKLLL